MRVTDWISATRQTEEILDKFDKVNVTISISRTLSHWCLETTSKNEYKVNPTSSLNDKTLCQFRIEKDESDWVRFYMKGTDIALKW